MDMQEHNKHGYHTYRLYFDGYLREAYQVSSYEEAKEKGENWKKKEKDYFYSISCG